MKIKVSQKKGSSNGVNPQLKDIAYSMDALIPGLYIWLGSFCWRLGGSDAEESYPGIIHSFAGISLVLPGYQIFTTYKGSYDPR
ncbi:MAG: hypothetical protein ACKPKF_07680 [Microcystis panniformis]